MSQISAILHTRHQAHSRGKTVLSLASYMLEPVKIAHERAAARCEARAKALRSRRIERHRRLARQAQRRSDTDRARRHLLAADDLENSALPLHIIEASAVARGTPFE